MEGDTGTFLCPDSGKSSPTLYGTPPTLQLTRDPGGMHSIPYRNPLHCRVISGTYGVFPFTLDFEWTGPGDTGVADWDDCHLSFSDGGNGEVLVTLAAVDGGGSVGSGSFSGAVIDENGKTVFSYGSNAGPARGLLPLAGMVTDYGINCLAYNFSNDSDKILVLEYGHAIALVVNPTNPGNVADVYSTLVALRVTHGNVERAIRRRLGLRLHPAADRSDGGGN